MAYKRGQQKPPGSGRKKGSLNKAKCLRVADVLAEAEKNPVEELLALIPSLQPYYQAKVWLELLSYCQAKPKEVEVPGSEEKEAEKLPEGAIEYLRNLAEGKAS